ncbi:unnamed protein product [Haemonchus placei]|uniref:BAT2_N domain-containing protein n=1 Tax=Haemonchus placei TaxID=6290 RepID=A0A0N4WTN6_HAEPC|nr:unnamed protein product [Haemonchus placei]
MPKTASETKSRQSEVKFRQASKSPGQKALSRGTAVNPTDILSPTSSSGNRLLTGVDKDSWNLAQNASSDTAASSLLATARTQTPSTKTGQLTSELSEEKKSPKVIIDEFLHKPANDQQKQSASSPTHLEATPHSKRKDAVSLQSLWLPGSTQQPQDRDSLKTARARSPLDARARTGPGPPAYQTLSPACTAIKDSTPPTPKVTTAAEIPMSPTPTVNTAIEEPMSSIRGVDTTKEILTAPRKSTNVTGMPQTSSTSK